MAPKRKKAGLLVKHELESSDSASEEGDRSEEISLQASQITKTETTIAASPIAGSVAGIGSIDSLDSVEDVESQQGEEIDMDGTLPQQTSA